VLGFLGPNGAGKTTIMKILCACHFPSQGHAKIDGIPVEEYPEEIKKRVGYLPESAALYGDMSPEEFLCFVASARLIPRKERREAGDWASAACGLEAHRTQRTESLSKGYKQRLALAQAIIHDPPILILDEPTSGLDPNQIIEIRSLIRELGKRKTVILSTHILQEVEALCSRVLILNEGSIAAQGTPEEIARSIGSGRGKSAWELYLKGAEAADMESRLARLALPAWASLFGVAAETLEHGIVRLCFTIDSTADSGSLPGGEARPATRERSGVESGALIFDWAVSQGYKITGMAQKKLSLEDIFVKLTADA
jgi:ABC-2 type transport system ATP-binding protein